MGRRLPVWLTPEEAIRVLEAARRPRDQEGRDYALVATGLYAGLRCQELANLDVEHVYLEHGVLEVHRGKGNKDRTLAIPEDLVAVLRGYLGGRRRGPVFQARYRGELARIGKKGLYDRIVEAGLRAGLRKRVHPHVLRHTCATTMLRRGRDITEVAAYLGHSTLRTTVIYLHCDPERLRGAAQAMNGAFREDLQRRLWAVS